MRHILHFSGRLPALTALVACATLTVWADCCTNEPFDGVVCYSETRKDPPTRLFIAVIDLTNPNLRLRVAPGGPDPDGPGPWQTTLMAPTRIAARAGFSLGVNADIFEARRLTVGGERKFGSRVVSVGGVR